MTYVVDRVTSIGGASKSSTDGVEAFLEDLSNWIAEEYGLDTRNVSPVLRQSQLEVQFDSAISGKFHAVAELGRAMTNLLESYGYELTTSFELAGFSMQADNTRQREIPFPTLFLIERRVGVPFEENKYFSQAPLRTQDHEDVLKQLEQVILAP